MFADDGLGYFGALYYCVAVGIGVVVAGVVDIVVVVAVAAEVGVAVADNVDLSAWLLTC